LDCLHFELGFVRNRNFHFLISPCQKSHGHPFFLLFEKTHFLFSGFAKICELRKPKILCWQKVSYWPLAARFWLYVIDRVIEKKRSRSPSKSQRQAASRQ
jgi:hypothetical protein